MLPRELSQNCCSLLKGKDRLALTLSVEVTPDGTVDGDARIKRSVICSRSRLTYLEAQKLIDEASQTEVPINGEVRNLSSSHSSFYSLGLFILKLREKNSLTNSILNK
jgi:exoribonuclease R